MPDRPSPPPPDGGGAARAGSVVRRGIERVAVRDGRVRRRRVRDSLATEEPLEIRLAQADGTLLPVSVTMRTPGSDFELAAGFLFSEGVVDDGRAVTAVRYCVDPQRDGLQRYNVVNVHLAPGLSIDAESLRRNFYTSSSCGVCGKTSIEAVLAPSCPRVRGGLRVSPSTLLSLPGRLRDTQRLFQRTGGLHAAALFDASAGLLRVREDVGRHNALDKLVGASLLAGELPLGERMVLVTSRLSFELVQKAVRAGVALLAGVSAPSSLAVELAQAAGLTLVGFLREGGFNVYAAGERIAGETAVPGEGKEAGGT